jgi:hypothetical protein
LIIVLTTLFLNMRSTDAISVQQIALAVLMILLTVHHVSRAGVCLLITQLVHVWKCVQSAITQGMEYVDYVISVARYVMLKTIVLNVDM